MKSIVSHYPSNIIKNICAFFIYFIFFLVLFFQFPFHGSLPGHWDTWLHLALYNYYWDYFKSLFGNHEIYYAMWPTHLPYFRYGEMSLLSAILYWPFKWILKNDLWAYYVHISSIYALVGFSMYQLSTLFVRSRLLAAIGGLLLITSNYYLASIDQVNVISAYPGILCIYFILKWYKTNKINYLYFASIFYGLQIYSSGYLFFYLNIIILILGLYYWTTIFNLKNFKHIVFAFIIGILIISPYIYLYIINSQESFCFNAGRNTEIVKALSFHWKYFINSLPYNLIYGDRLDRTLIENIKSISLGLLLPLIAFLSIFSFTFTRRKLAIISILIILILFGLGPLINIGNFTFPSPIYQFILAPSKIDNFLRTPVRAMIPILIIIVLLALKSLEKFKNKKLIAFIVIGILIENIPYRFQYFNSEKYIDVPKELLNFTQNMPKENILLITPTSRMTEKKLNPNLGETNREYIYMYWQTQFEKTMMNGGNGFIPYKSIQLYNAFNNNSKISGSFKIDNKTIDAVYLPLMEIK